jgi:hypothetical protein
VVVVRGAVIPRMRSGTGPWAPHRKLWPIDIDSEGSHAKNWVMRTPPWPGLGHPSWNTEGGSMMVAREWLAGGPVLTEAGQRVPTLSAKYAPHLRWRSNRL